MRRLFFGIFLLLIFNSCDDGEIIVTNFDFEDSSLRTCQGSNKNVIYAINSGDVNESISLEFSSSVLEFNESGKILPPENDSYSFPLSATNRVVYRLYNGEVSNDYFCNVVPPSEPDVVEEWISGTGGIVTISTSFGDESGSTDADGDGLKNSEEGWSFEGESLDTDSDGIPNYLDIDDDNDNVKTVTELANSADDPVTENGFRDTDEDGIPNYLDDDDDDDNVLTRYEVQEGDELNPTVFQTAQGIPNYLNPEQTASLEHDLYLNHDITRSYNYQINISNLKFTKNDGSGESIQFQTYNFGTLQESSIEFLQCPSMDLNCGTEEQ